jgi:hypothetical protein
MLALVEAAEATQVCRGGVGGDGAFPVAGQSRGIVRARGQCEFTGVVRCGGHIGVAHQPGLLEVAVGQVAGGVGVGDHAAGNVPRELGAPEDGGVVVGEEDPTHARRARVDSTKDGWCVGDELGEMSGPRGEVGRQGLEVLQVVADVAREADAVALGVLDPELESAEQPRRARDPQACEAELAEVLLPLLEAHPFLVP